MRKRLVALLSLAGLASSSTPGTSQLSQVKDDKVKQENAAAQDDASKKMRKAGGEQQANQDVVTEKVGPDRVVKTKEYKRAKVAAENSAIHATKENKVKWVTGESDAVKNESGKKYRKAGKEQDALTLKQKTTAHATVDAGAGKAKFKKNAAETKAAQQNMEQKAGKATPK